MTRFHTVSVLPFFLFSQGKKSGSSATFSRFYSGHAGGDGANAQEEDERELSGKGVGRYNPLFHNATVSCDDVQEISLFVNTPPFAGGLMDGGGVDLFSLFFLRKVFKLFLFVADYC